MRAKNGTGIAIGVALAALACGGGEVHSAASAHPSGPAPANEVASASEPVSTLPPEIAEILRSGPGGPIQDEGFVLDPEPDAERPLRIVLRRN